MIKVYFVSCRINECTNLCQSEESHSSIVQGSSISPSQTLASSIADIVFGRVSAAAAPLSVFSNDALLHWIKSCQFMILSINNCDFTRSNNPSGRSVLCAAPPQVGCDGHQNFDAHHAAADVAEQQCLLARAIVD
jgi:hypothetical protein